MKRNVPSEYIVGQKLVKLKSNIFSWTNEKVLSAVKHTSLVKKILHISELMLSGVNSFDTGNCYDECWY